MPHPSLRRARPALSLAAALLAFPLAAVAPVQAPAARGFDPVAFFTGRTSGHGFLKKAFSARQATRVVGTGRVEGGALLLDQTVAIAGEKTRERHWRLRQLAPGRWSGTISDARGPVVASAAGAVLTIRYTSDQGMGVAQTVTLAPDGRSARNRMKIRKLGLTVATIDETIVRDAG